MDEDGVDVVEAIDAWIDEQIEDLTDEELESILEILDAVSASELANLDADDVYDDDIDQMVDEKGGSAADRVFSEAVLRSAYFNEPFAGTLTAGADPDAGDPDPSGPDAVDADPSDPDAGDAVPSDSADLDDDADSLFSGLIDADATQSDPNDSEPDTGDLDHDPDTADLDDSDPDLENLDDSDLDDNDTLDSGFLSDLKHAYDLDNEVDTGADDIGEAGHNDFLADLASTGTSTADMPAGNTTAAAPVELRPFDDLGPTFLPELAERIEPKRRRRSIGQVLLPVFMIAGLAVFAFGMLQLVNSLGDGDAEVATELSETPTAEPQATADPTAIPATAEPLDPSAPTPTPTPEPLPPARISIRLVTGDVVLATYSQPNALPEMSTLYEVGDDFEPATDVAWIGEDIGVVDTDGNVFIVDPGPRQTDPTMIYEAGGGFAEAVEITAVDGLVAIRTDDGSITLTPSNGRADPDVIELAWDAEEQGAAATDMSSVDDLLAFVLDDGTAQALAPSDDDSLVQLWVADDQPEAFNLAASPTGILLGVGQGAVARYQLGSLEGDRLESVWDPFSGDEQPAIGYSPAGESTAIILGDGTILLTDSDSSGRTLWDPAETEIRAFVAVGDDDHVVVLLETGSIVRIPIDADELIESIWDITDETLNPAVQLVVEPRTR